MMEAERVIAIMHQEQGAWLHSRSCAMIRDLPHVNVSIMEHRYVWLNKIRHFQEHSAWEYKQARYQMGMIDDEKS